MDRRSFFKAGLGKVSRTAVKIADEHVNQRAIRWVRPPFAHDELDFLIACTRCDKCIEACPHDVIFKLPARLGLQVAGTPAMDLVNKACHLCEDWPCVQACEPEALQFPEHNDDDAGEKPRSFPVLAKAAINSQTCLPYIGPECGACADSCPVPGALLWNGPHPQINYSKCIGCGLCRQACILEPKAIKINSVYLQPEDNP